MGTTTGAWGELCVNLLPLSDLSALSLTSPSLKWPALDLVTRVVTNAAVTLIHIW